MVGLVGGLVVFLKAGASLPVQHRATRQHMLWFWEFCFSSLVLEWPLTQKLACPLRAGEGCRVLSLQDCSLSCFAWVREAPSL